MSHIFITSLALLAVALPIVKAETNWFASQNFTRLKVQSVGDATFFDTEVGLGACGKQNNNQQFIAALSFEDFGEAADPNKSPMCQKCIMVSNEKRWIYVQVVDKCAACKKNDVDLTPTAFTALIPKDGKIPPLDNGRVKVDTRIEPCNPSLVALQQGDVGSGGVPSQGSTPQQQTPAQPPAQPPVQPAQPGQPPLQQQQNQPLPKETSTQQKPSVPSDTTTSGNQNAGQNIYRVINGAYSVGVSQILGAFMAVVALVAGAN